ncbi:MAG: serine phosphatase RsbU, regulator of sigma subunit [Cyanobacteriota bacterium]|jgi:sigma-B regulation protein RsbU (phosphoserine phosphatase)
MLSSGPGSLSSVQEDLRIAADIQQRMLLSKQRLKAVSSSLDCYAFMVPCRDIGGDFFDLIQLDADHIAVVIGDVSGKGFPAAMMMATCITLLRAYFESFRSPSRIMRKVNPRLIDGNEEECLFTTLFLGMINCHRNSFTYCNAGHNPPLLQRSDGSIEELSDIHGPAVGVMEAVEYEETRIRLDVGDRLLLYTDGASETFNGSGELYGSGRLVQFMRGAPLRQPSRRTLSNLLFDLTCFSGNELSHDDITLVCVQRRGEAHGDQASLLEECPANHAGMAQLMQAADRFCQEQEIGAEISGRLQLALDELLVNVVSYGQGQAELAPRLILSLRYREGLLIVELRDTGLPFNPFAIAEPDTDLSLDERDPGGLGVFLVRTLTESFSYSYEAPYNIVHLEIVCAA